MQKKKKIKSEFSSVMKLLIPLLGQSCHVPSTGSSQLPRHSWVPVVTAFVFGGRGAFELRFYSSVVCTNELLFEMPVIPLGFRLLIHSHGSVPEWELRLVPRLHCSPAAAQSPTSPPPSYPETHNVPKPGEFNKMKCRIHVVIYERLEPLCQKSRLNYNVSIHPGLFNEEDSLIYTVKLRFPYLVAHRILTLMRYLLHRFSLGMT